MGPPGIGGGSGIEDVDIIRVGTMHKGSAFFGSDRSVEGVNFFRAGTMREVSEVMSSKLMKDISKEMMSEGRAAKYLGWERVDSGNAFIYESNGIGSCYSISKVEMETGKLLGMSVLFNDDESIIARLKNHYNWMGGRLN